MFTFASATQLLELEVIDPQPMKVSVGMQGGFTRTIEFEVLPGYDYLVEYRNDLVNPPDWQPLPDAPHNSGVVEDTDAVDVRAYRIRRQ